MNSSSEHLTKIFSKVWGRNTPAIIYLHLLRDFAGRDSQRFFSNFLAFTVHSKPLQQLGLSQNVSNSSKLEPHNCCDVIG